MATDPAPSETEIKSIVGVPRERMPRHIAMIMDGNGRWAQRQGLPRGEGHRQGGETVRRITEESARLGIEQLTLFCFSSENWKRPKEELEFLMTLLKYYLENERQTLIDSQVRLTTIGQLDQLPSEVRIGLQQAVSDTANHSGICVCLAINYGGRDEIVRAARRFSEDVRRGVRQPEELDEALFAQHLDTRGMIDPDLLIRTAGEFRISNYLLWQISYSEIWVTEKPWPEFDEADLHRAIRDFAGRERRFGGLAPRA